MSFGRKENAEEFLKNKRRTSKIEIKYYIHALNYMRRFWDNKREEEKIKEDTGTIDGNLECEEQIIDDIERFGRVRTTLMRSLRRNYGNRTANRALWRVSKRKTNGYLQENSMNFHNSSLQDLARLFSK